MPGLKTTTYGTGSYAWLKNTFGLDYSVQGVLTISSLTKSTHYPNGFIPSGTPLRVDDLGNIRPWSDTSGAKLGFLKGDVKTDGTENLNVSFVARAEIKVPALPVAFTVPTTAPQTQFNFWSV